MTVLQQIDKHFEEWVMITLLIGIGVVMLTQVVLRYVFVAPLSWAEEVCRYLFVWTAFLSIGYSFRSGRVLAVDALYSKFPEVVRKVVDVVGSVLTLGLFAFLFIRAIHIYGAIGRSGQVSSALEFPMKYVYLAAPVGLGLGVFRYAQSLVTKYRPSLRAEISA